MDQDISGHIIPETFLFHLFNKIEKKIIITIESYMYVSKKTHIQHNNILQKNLFCILTML